MSIWQRVCFWGTRPEEIGAPWPCDGRAVAGETSLYRAIDIVAPPEQVFRWLCQLKIAPYSYDWIDNGGRRSPQQLTPGAEHLEIGQRVMSIFTLVDFETDRFMTLVSKGRGPLGPVTLTYRLLSSATHAAGGEPTRLVARLRIVVPRNLIGTAARVGLSLGDWVMMRKQFLTLKALAERRAEDAGP